MKSIKDIEAVDFIARPTDPTPALDTRDDDMRYIALIAVTYKDGSHEYLYHSMDYHPTTHAAVWDAKKIWRRVYLNGHAKI